MTESGRTLHLQIEQPRPYFAELPYYLWGETNYDSEGDCKKPTDREWTWINLENRETHESVSVRLKNDVWVVEGAGPSTARLAIFLRERCDASVSSSLRGVADHGAHAAAMARASRVAREFAQPALAPFDTHLFWGSWKWIGWYSTDLTWVGRWIMHSVVRRDPRAISLCIGWLKETKFPEQAGALSYAVQYLSGEAPRTPKKWIRWYEGGWFSKGARRRFPEPDFEEWLKEMKRDFGDHT